MAVLSKIQLQVWGKKRNPFLEKLVGFYPFDGNSNDVVNAHNGTDTSVSYTALGSKNALTFTAQNQFSEVADNDDFSFTDGIQDLPFTIATNLLVSGYSSAGNRFLGKCSDSTTREWLFILNSTMLIFFIYSNASDTISKSYRYAHSFALNQKYHIGVSFDGSDVKIFIDGVEKTITTSSSGTYVKMANSTAQLYIGKATGVANCNHLGKLQNTAIWKNRNLSSSEMLILSSNNGNPLL